jgi:hypothetical protein
MQSIATYLRSRIVSGLLSKYPSFAQLPADELFRAIDRCSGNHPVSMLIKIELFVFLVLLSTARVWSSYAMIAIHICFLITATVVMWLILERAYINAMFDLLRNVHRHRFCQRCGYGSDVSVSGHGIQCPECGA